MLRTPGTYGAIVRAGPIARQARRLRALFEDPHRTAVIAVAQPSELAVNETLDLEDRLRDQLGLGLAIVIVNAMLPRRFSPADIDTLSARSAAVPGRAARAGADTARSTYVRWREQSNQLNRLRRHLDARVITVPFVFARNLDLPAVEGLAGVIERRLQRE
jgi:anion-transporting  ArsA/GET3 family ATPase